jgi:ribose transport system substrate-binding protein
VSFHIGESCPFANGPAVRPTSLGQRRRADELGWRLTSLDAALSAERQAQHLEQLVELGVDALTAWTLDAELAEPHYARAAAAGIPVVTFNSESPSATTVVRQRADTSVPADDAAAYIAERRPGARLLVVGGPPIAALVARAERFLEAAARSGLQVVARDDNIGDVEETARPVVERLFDHHPDVDAIWCFNDNTAVAAAALLRERGRPVWSGTRPGVIVSGIGGTPAAIEAIRRGRMTLTYDSLPTEAGKAAIDVLEGILVRGQRTPRETWVHCVRYDVSNVGAYIPWDKR